MFPQVSQNWRRGEFFFQDPEIRHGAGSEGVCAQPLRTHLRVTLHKYFSLALLIIYKKYWHRYLGLGKFEITIVNPIMFLHAIKTVQNQQQ